MGSDGRIERVGNRHFRMRIARESVLLEPLELGGDPRELVDLPRRRAVVIDQPEERLLLAAAMTIECPRENPLCADQEAQISIHPASSRCSVVAAAARRELIEPDWRGQCAFELHGTKGTADRICRIEALGTK